MSYDPFGVDIRTSLLVEQGQAFVIQDPRSQTKMLLMSEDDFGFIFYGRRLHTKYCVGEREVRRNRKIKAKEAKVWPSS